MTSFRLSKNHLSLDDSANLKLEGSAGDDTLLGSAGDDVIHGLAGNDLISGSGGDDRMFGGDGSDILRGGNGDDYLDGGAGNDTLRGGDGHDHLYGGRGRDTLEGGAGADYLSGGLGNDTYLLELSDYYDTITDGGGVDSIRFGASIQASDVKLTHVSSNLYITQLSTGANIAIIEGQFNGPDWAIESLQFADGTIWDQSTIEAVANTATQWDDYLRGTDGNDIIDGLGGNDTISGDGGNDTLRGGSGADILYGGSGNNTLDGGSGGDTLTGGADSDTYLFGIGSHWDTVQFDYGGVDTLRFAEGITASDVTLSRSGFGYDLILKIKATGDQFTFQNQFLSGVAHLEFIKFADGTTWDDATITQMSMQGTSGNDVLMGTTGNDVMNGYDGNDMLMGYEGNDSMSGGNGDDGLDGHTGDDVMNGGSGDDNIHCSGNDTATGGEGNDRFLFDGPLEGVTTIVDFQHGPDNISLSHWNFPKLGTGGALSFFNFVSNATGDAVDADDYILYENDTGKLFYDADGNGAGAKVQFALIGTAVHPALQVSDFSVS